MATQERKHGIEAAGAGDLGVVPAGTVIGKCPSCSAEVSVVETMNPASGNVERALMHAVPFCTYFGKTAAAFIEQEIAKS